MGINPNRPYKKIFLPNRGYIIMYEDGSCEMKIASKFHHITVTGMHGQDSLPNLGTDVYVTFQPYLTEDNAASTRIGDDDYALIKISELRHHSSMSQDDLLRHLGYAAHLEQEQGRAS